MRTWLILAAAIVLIPLGCGGGPAPQFAGQSNTESYTDGVPAQAEPPAAPPAAGQAPAKGAAKAGRLGRHYWRKASAVATVTPVPEEE